jgi:hypothetical protein
VKHGINSEWWLIGPEKADELLAQNDVNRRKRPTLVSSYAGDMKAGLWDTENGETIKISNTGKLKDGQHRLEAIREAGVTLELYVTTGIPDVGQKTIDQGAKRTVKDVLQMQGIPNASWVASLARWCLLGGEPGPNLETKLKQKGSAAQIAKIVDEQPDIVLAAGRYSTLTVHIMGGPTALCYSWLWMHRTDPGACEEFWGSMIDLTFKALNDPRKACLKALQRMEREEGITTASKDKSIATVSILTRSWNLWRKGEQIQSLSIKQNGRIIPPEKPI